MLQDNLTYLLKALALASTRRGFCAPNPAVGAVIVKNDEIVAEGVHYACGEPHAEIMALREFKGDLSDATLYVTLEPCCHTGRTPPCTDAIIASGLQRVVYSYQDPNPIVASQGHQRLVAAGIDTEHVACSEIDQFYRSYCYWQDSQRPWVTAKIAMSLDGKIAGPAGERISITGTALKQQTYAYRLRCDAILTTAKTISHDNPLLNIIINKDDKNHNVADFIKSNNLSLSKRLYILDSHLNLTSDFQIWKNDQPITVFYSSKNSGKLPDDLLERGVRFISVDELEGLLDLEQIMGVIGSDGVHDLWVEAGGRLLRSLIETNAIHKLLVYCAPKWLGDQAQSAFNEGIYTFDQFALKQWHVIGEEAILEMSCE
ncbi:MAG: bifunctional diaminohydroxyphosphoribosylaminopyrimidine deaminase/5-amino-6-(5-phosphoribosylamino)uracil reductase RibD [Gammaproteobacteria bacterium]|nr:bifunctional diaminohydroxyphosphoribosylaminopyrimidine deaminase/5-amino-6-(5-phosphoribosylamino)uracil reductase RibD [Gammaproteobacteria bacterium]